MSTRALTLTLCLAGTAAGLGLWAFSGHESPAEAAQAAATSPPAPRVTKRLPAAPDAAASPESASPATPALAGIRPVEPARPKASPGGTPAPQPALSIEEMTRRAAKVEQEANHDLRRLVGLLQLDEQQQDRVFETLARHSSAWVPGMQVGGAVSGPASGTTQPVTGDTAADAATDPMEEIMALLSPEQQDALLQDEMDRTAWWAEILPQITPPDEVPSLDGGGSQAYEGSTTLD